MSDYDSFSYVPGKVKTDALGRKDDESKARYDLLPPEALEEVVNIYTTGAIRYGDRNWEKGIQYSRMYAAAMRHLQAWWMGEEFDKEQPTNRHLASVAWYCLGLMHFEMRGIASEKNLDDRPYSKQEDDDPTVKDFEVEDIYTKAIRELEEENTRLRKELSHWENEYAGQHR